MTGPASAAVKPLTAVQANSESKPLKSPPKYVVVSSGAIDNPANTESYGTAYCPGNTVVLGGGVSSNSNATDVYITFSAPIHSSAQEEYYWAAYINNASDSDASFDVYAVCAKQPENYSLVYGGGLAGNTYAEAKCPKGTSVLGGGGESPSSDAGLNQTFPFKRGRWYVSENQAGQEDLASIAICGNEAAVTTVEGEDVDNPQGEQSVATATCPAGTVPLGGGVSLGQKAPIDTTLLSTNGTIPTPHGWKSAENNGSTKDSSLDAWVVCGS
jgi:hypothetical protein